MSRWTHKALLVPVRSLQPQIDNAYLEVRDHLLARFPGARVDHVGSTALAPALCRGVIDLDLVVDPKDLHEAEEAAASASLPPTTLPISVQVHSMQQPSPRLRHRQTLAEHPLLLGEFIGLQKQFAHRLGRPYPLAKARFFEMLTQGDEYASIDMESCLPYPIELEAKAT